MDRIELCKQCKNRKRDLRVGIICGLTNEKPDAVGNQSDTGLF